MRAIAALGAFVACAATTSAGQVIQSGSVPLQRTDWNAVVALDPFDEMDGARVLQSVRWTLDARVEGAARAESFDSVPVQVTLELSALVEAILAGRTISEAAPLIEETFTASAYDGVFDFAGASGASFTGLAGGVRLETTSLDPADFLGPDPIMLSLTASGASRSVGGGSIATEFDTLAGAEWTLEYIYRVVPAPSGAGVLALAIALGARRRRTGSTRKESVR